MTGNSLSQDLAGWTLGLRYEDLPERVVADVKLRVLDTLGLIISGAGTPMGRAVHAASSGLGSGRRARLIPSGKRTSVPTAALAHGTQAHAEDFDDTHNESIMHSSAPVVATVLALAGRIACTLDPEPPSTTQYRGVVTVETKDGRRETVEIPHNRGSRKNPMREDEIVAKFEACAGSLSSGQRRRVIDRVFALESAEFVAEVVSACT